MCLLLCDGQHALAPDRAAHPTLPCHVISEPVHQSPLKEIPKMMQCTGNKSKVKYTRLGIFHALPLIGDKRTSLDPTQEDFSERLKQPGFERWTQRPQQITLPHLAPMGSRVLVTTEEKVYTFCRRTRNQMYIPGSR